ncbi:OmpA family protein [Vibrio sp. TRT 1302]|uniref:OmpA family protein n=1 Tax=Vibrio sp. TRT 1302 TaxID=3418504 RepID=UPI003CEB12CE
MLNKQHYLLILASLLVFESSRAEENSYTLSPFIGQKDGYQFPVDTSNGQASKGTMLGIYGGLEFNRMYSWDIGFQQRGDLDTENASTTSIVESALKYDYFLSNDYSIYARVGVAYWDSKKSQSTLKGVSPMVEAGLTYWVTDKFRVSGGYQYIDEIDNYNSHTLLFSAAFTLGSSVPRLPSVSPMNMEFDEPVLLEAVEPVDSRMNSIYFDTDSYDIDGQQVVEQKAQRIICVLKKSTQAKVELIGHTDAEGTDEYNQTLSENRARSVAMWLEGMGILPEQIEAKGEGASKPITSNMTPESRALNRRVEMRLLTVDDSETSCESDTP